MSAAHRGPFSNIRPLRRTSRQGRGVLGGGPLGIRARLARGRPGEVVHRALPRRTLKMVRRAAPNLRPTAATPRLDTNPCADRGPAIRAGRGDDGRTLSTPRQSALRLVAQLIPFARRGHPAGSPGKPGGLTCRRIEDQRSDAIRRCVEGVRIRTWTAGSALTQIAQTARQEGWAGWERTVTATLDARTEPPKNKGRRALQSAAKVGVAEKV